MLLMEILNKSELNRNDLIQILSAESDEDMALLNSKANSVLIENCGNNVFLRGLLEFSNICINDCYYCGIRNSNKSVKRYFLDKTEIMKVAAWCAEQGFGSIVLQSGERNDELFISAVEDFVRAIKISTKSTELPNGLGITLSVGEQSIETYKRWFEAGAHRYLLRIETSSPELFNKIHPSEQRFDSRLQALKNIRETGFQVGTGVMIGLPGQTLENLVDDIMFFKIKM